MSKLDAADLPAGLRTDWAGLIGAFEAVPPMRGETAIQSTVRKLSNDELEALAARVVTLFGQVARLSTPRAVEDVRPATEALPTPDAEPRTRFAAEA